MGNIGSALANVIEWAPVPLVLILLWTYGFFQLPGEAAPARAVQGARATRWTVLSRGTILFLALGSALGTLLDRAFSALRPDPAEEIKA